MTPNDPQAAQFLVFYTKAMSAPNGGREYTHTIDGVKQYPDKADLQPLRMQLLLEHEPISKQ